MQRVDGASVFPSQLYYPLLSIELTFRLFMTWPSYVGMNTIVEYAILCWHE